MCIFWNIPYHNVRFNLTDYLVAEISTILLSFARDIPQIFPYLSSISRKILFAYIECSLNRNIGDHQEDDYS